MGPIGLKGDQGPTGVPGDPAKGVRTNLEEQTIENVI